MEHFLLQFYFNFQCYLLTTTSASAAYKSELNLQGLRPHYSGSSSNADNVFPSRSTSSRLSHIEAITDITNMAENAEDINNSLAAIGSIASRVQQGHQGGGQHHGGHQLGQQHACCGHPCAGVRPSQGGQQGGALANPPHGDPLTLRCSFFTYQFSLLYSG